MMEIERTSLQEWIRLRANAVRDIYSAFDCLNEKGLGEAIPDQSTPTQIPCAFHGPDRKPSARYYPKSGSKHDYVRCYKCRENWDAIGLYAKFHGTRFMDALGELERRFRVHVPRRPEGPEIVEPADRGAAYVSDQWADVPRVVAILEAKLLRIRDRCGISDYVKFCRVIDAVSWDFDKLGIQTPEMAAALKKVMERMDETALLPEFER